MPLRAQVPRGVRLGRYLAYDQISATQLRAKGAGFVAQAGLDASANANTVVQLRSPDGTTTPLARRSDGVFELRVPFATAAEAATAYPDGNYILVVSGGPNPSTTPLVMDSQRLTLPAPALITNFDALQAWPDPTPKLTLGSFQVRQPSGPFPPPPDGMEFTIAKDDGTILLDRTMTATTESGNKLVSVSSYTIEFPLPFLTPLHGKFGYNETNYFSLVNNVNLQVTAGFEVDFPLRCAGLPPIINVQPQSMIGRIGTTVPLDIATSGIGSGSFQYQLKKNGVLVTNVRPDYSFGVYNSAEFAVPITQASDAGTYTIEVSYGGATSTSAPAIVVVAPRVVLTPYAGSHIPGYQDGPAGTARFDAVTGLAPDAVGNLYVVERSSCTVRVVSADGIVRTLAGAPGESGTADGVGSAARFGLLTAVAVDAAGNLYVTDAFYATVRKVTPAGVVTTLAGAAGQRGAADGLGPAARFNGLSGLAIDPAGNLYVCDDGNRTVRKITPAGLVTTVAGLTGEAGTADGVGAAARFMAPGKCKFAAGALYLVDQGLVRRLAADGTVATLTGLSLETGDDGLPTRNTQAFDLAPGPAGSLFTASASDVRQMTVGGVTATVANDVTGALAVDAQGAVYVADGYHSIILKGAFAEGSKDPHLAMTAAPQPLTVAPGASVAFSAQATGPRPSYQWRKDGVNLPGATLSTLLLDQTTAADRGTYSVWIGNAAGVLAPAPAALSFLDTNDPGHLTNLSVRSTAGTGAQTLIAGVVVAGGAPGVSTPVLVRGVGPGLAGFGVANALGDPTLTLARGDNPVVATNDDWGGGAALTTAMAAVGAFALAPGSRDAVLSAPMANGAYSVQVAGKNNATGVALLEVYAQPGAGGAPANAPRLVNLSARSQVGTGAEVLIAGFAIGGATGKTVLIRGLGPALDRFGVTGALHNPLLQVFDARRTLVAANDDLQYGDPLGPVVGRVAEKAGAFAVGQSLDSALVVTLPPGSYTAKVSGVDGTTGVGLIEIYEVP